MYSALLYLSAAAAVDASYIKHQEYYTHITLQSTNHMHKYQLCAVDNPIARVREPISTASQQLILPSKYQMEA